MKTYLPLCVLCILFFVSACTHQKHHDPDQPMTTSLNIDQVNKLSPYMVDLKKEGAMISTLDTVRMGDSIIAMQHRNQQNFSFKVWVDAEHHPVMPDSTNTSARRGGGGWQNGSITTFCLGGCLMVNTQLCLMEGCTPLENACGCRPPVCGICADWGCSSIVLGLISGNLIL